MGVATALVAGFGLFAGTAIASPTVPSDDDIASVDAAADDTAARIAALESELAASRAAYDAAAIEAAVAAEDYNEAVVALEAAEAEKKATATEAATARAELDEASAALAELAMASYRSGGDLAQLGALLSADGLEDALAQATTFQVLGTSSADAEQRYTEAEVAAQVADERAADAVADADAAAQELEEASQAADAAAAEAAGILQANETRHAGLVTELAELRQTSVEMEEARQQAAEEERLAQENAAAAAALGVEGAAADGAGQAAEDATEEAAADEPAQESQPTQAPPADEPTAEPTTPEPTTPAPTTPAPTTSKPKPPPSSPPPAPPSSSANAAALAWAKTQLGKPYVYGAAGPNSYDCSGLTMQAYRHAGISIPRTSASQYYAGDLVPVGQMKPGDLFFYSDNGSPSGIYHVAIYAGNGMRLHAPSPGKYVELVPMWWPNVLDYAVRP